MRAASALCTVLSSAVALTLFAGTTGSWERDRSCVFPLSENIAGLVDGWHRAIAAGDVAAITATYSPDAILMGIGEHAIRLGRREIAAHYDEMLRETLVVTPQSRVIESSCSTAIVTGLQQIKIGRGAQEARGEIAYKMMYAYGDGVWLLIHHHFETLSALTRPRPVAQTDGTSRITTSTLPQQPGTLALPPPAFHLSASPPVFMPQVLPHVLSSRRPTEPAPVADKTDFTLPPLAISTGAFPIISSSRAEQAEPLTKPVEIVVPLPKIDIGAFPAIGSPVSAVQGRPAPMFVPPRLNLDVGAFPLPTPPGRAESPPASPAPPSRTASVASVAPRAATAVRSPPSAAKPQVDERPVDKPKPVRSQPTVRPTAVAAPVAAVPPKSGSSYRPVRRWDGQLPIFETD
jgi:uncharacterized protein (TIGR02246 family)